MNNFIIRLSIAIGILMLFSWAMRGLAEVDFVPSLNVFVKKYLYIPGILFSIVIYLVARKWLLDSLALRVIMLFGLGVCIFLFFIDTTFNNRYNETVALTLSIEQKLYVSKIEVQVFDGQATRFKAYRNEFPFSNTIRVLYATQVSLIGEDSSSYILQGSTVKGLDTVYIPKRMKK